MSGCLPADGPYRRIGGDKGPQPAVQIAQICATVTGTRDRRGYTVGVMGGKHTEVTLAAAPAAD